jgi:hypothetical protein
MTELDEARIYANKLLDEPYADPDDNVRVVCRQFNRRDERAQQLEKEVEELRKQLVAALDPTWGMEGRP